MFDDLFDDAALRLAFEATLGVRSRPWDVMASPPRWFFERTRYGLRDVELGPIGLYSPVCVSEAAYDRLLTFIGEARSSPLARVRVNVNPLDARADDLAQHAAACGYRIVQNQTHLLNIEPSIDAMRQRYHGTKRYQALRDVKPRFSIGVATDAAQLEDYFTVYADSLQRWGRAGFIYPRALFTALLACPSAKFWMNHVEGRLACAMVVLHCRSYALYWQGVSKIDADQKAAYPMVRLMDAVLQDLALSGIPCLNLGASDGLPNVRRFKEEFGARAVAYPSLVYESPVWRTLAGARRLLNRRPA